jgi:hypothetical protein
MEKGNNARSPTRRIVTTLPKDLIDAVEDYVIPDGETWSAVRQRVIAEMLEMGLIVWETQMEGASLYEEEKLKGTRRDRRLSPMLPWYDPETAKRISG